MKQLTTLLLGLILLVGCNTSKRNNPEETIYVTIAPLKGIVEAIVGPDYPIEVLVPAGASPENFEPTARQMADLSRSPLILAVGWIDFEKNLLRDMEAKGEVVNLNRGIRPIAGSCSHDHLQGKGHRHGIDPHVWTSPKELQRMANTAYKAITKLHPDSLSYKRNYMTLRNKLLSLDMRTSAKIRQSGITSFLIYHPAFTYYARAYGIEQIAIEAEGKEPSARRLSEIITSAEEQAPRYIFYQSQYPVSTVEVIASDLGAEAVAIDPLKEDIISEIERFTELLCSPSAQQ